MRHCTIDQQRFDRVRAREASAKRRDALRKVILRSLEEDVFDEADWAAVTGRCFPETDYSLLDE